MVKCPSCGRDNADHFNFCLDCGYDLKAYREAFPHGIPVAPPPPQPARTEPVALAAAPPSSSAPAVAYAPVPPPSSAPPSSALRSTHVGGGSSVPVDAATFPPLPPQRPAVDHPPAWGPPAQDPAWGAPAHDPAWGAPPAPAYDPAPAAWGAPLPAAPLPAAPLPAAPLPAAPLPAASMVAAPLPAAPMVAAPSPSPMATLACAACGHVNAGSFKFCANCGKRLEVGAPAEGGAARTMFMHAADMQATVREKLCKLVAIDQSGREGMTFTIKSGETLCGRENGVILFFDDPYVSPTHCKFAFHNGALKVIDQNSLNGVYQRVRQERRLVGGDLVRVGRQLFRYETLAMAAFQVKKAEGDSSRIWGSPTNGAFGRLVQILDDGRTGEIRLLSGDRCQLGREVGDIVLPTDGFISGRHCAFSQQNGETMLTDLGSSNGTYVRIRGEADVAHGDFLLVGNQMLRVEII